MNTRIAEIRKKSHLTQEQFAEKMGISKNYVNLIENGKKSPGNRLVSDICRIFNINEEWLQYGTEPMYKPHSAKLSTYLGEISAGDDYLIQDIIEVYMELDQASKDALKISIDKLAKKRMERVQD